LGAAEGSAMTPTSQYRVFVLMPFAAKFDNLLKQIELAAADAGAHAERVDQQLHDQDILERIIDQIEQADAIVAVMTGNSPNVFYEVGIAHALKKHVLLLTCKPEEIPFDVAHCKHVIYASSKKKCGAAEDSKAFRKKVTEELAWMLRIPRVADSYYQEYKRAMLEMDASSRDLAQYLTPIGKRCFSQWAKYVQSLVSVGIDMTGSERLEITRLLVHATNKYRVIERMIGDPDDLNSLDWTDFYNELAQNADVEKKWILCTAESEVLQHLGVVEASWHFRKERNFETWYCSPQQLERSGKKLPAHEVIEDFGQYVKFLNLPSGSYTSGDKPNELRTIFKSTDVDHQQMIEAVLKCSNEINEEWIAMRRKGRLATGSVA
jgi:nucleoside 2-deoxyribosyltransferase